MKSSAGKIWRPILATLCGMSLYALLLPEISGGLNSVLTAIFNSPFPPEEIHKWHVTAGITRDFIDLRHSLTADTRNPRSLILFILFHVTAIVPAILLMVGRRVSK